MPVADHEHAVGKMAMRGVAEGRRIADEIEDLAAKRPDVRGASRRAVLASAVARGRVQRLAPCANHAATRARSSSVIWVRLPIGM